ncbi:alginate export family protein [Chitinophaga horti]|uniref:Alginate export family protein n=1 Tax=Chitinophaga horti TaxID=2920382 RepID=A0ABY6J156_9BACT|nr:alginate export family protein [Chitinophaga horti]UYQ93380.1 alginate export family protein [Chitinophaga horti]
MFCKKLFRTGACIVLVTIGCYAPLKAQLTLDAQLRTRTEYRDGQGAPLPKTANPALFTSQRTRMAAGWSGYRLKFGLTVQDVRVWGQDVSTINRTTTQDNNGLMLHEAWGEVFLTDTIVKNRSLSLKIGRQELNYDDGRLLGNLDWLQQARRHDGAVLKYETGPWMLHAGGAFNQNKENAAGTLYNGTPPGAYPANTNGGAMYKGMEFIYAGRKLKKGNVSLLLFADQFSRYHNDSVDNKPVKTWDAGAYHRFTGGVYFTNTFHDLTVTSSAYYQTGKTADGVKLDAALFSAAFQYALSKKVSVGIGGDYTTGGGAGKAFDPLYGTPHKFWGYMDYFYVASGFGARGLQDYYLRLKTKPGERWMLNADVHQFYSASDIVGHNRNFGQELDLTANFALTKVIGFEAGYSFFNSQPNLTSPGVKNVANAQSANHWAYLMINIKPSLLFK